MREGVEACNQRVCCRTTVRARVPLRSNGVPASFSAPVLPVFDGDGGLWDGSEEARRRRHLGSGSVVHGSELFALPADFLCKDCASVFLAKEFDFAALSKEEVAEWRRRLRLQSRFGREALRLEHARALAREELLHLAKERRFDAFREKALACVRVQAQDSVRETPCVLEEVAVSSLERAARKALEPALFVRGVSAEQREWCRRRFGVSRQTEGLYRCLPLCRGGDARELCDWTAYTGAPGLLSERVWLCRLWARALGGVERMPTKVPQGVNDFCRLRDLEAVEALEDFQWLRVPLPAGPGCAPSGAFALELKPEGSSVSVSVWKDVLSAAWRKQLAETEKEKAVPWLSAVAQKGLPGAETLSRLEGQAMLVRRVSVAARAEAERWGVALSGDHHEVDVCTALREAHRMCLLRPLEEALWQRCESHAAKHGGVYPRETMLGAGENDRFDHVRREEALLARESHQAAIRVAKVFLAERQMRASEDWLALPEVEAAMEVRQSGVGSSAPEVGAGLSEAAASAPSQQGWREVSSRSRRIREAKVDPARFLVTTATASCFLDLPRPSRRVILRTATRFPRAPASLVEIALRERGRRTRKRRRHHFRPSDSTLMPTAARLVWVALARGVRLPSSACRILVSSRPRRKRRRMRQAVLSSAQSFARPSFLSSLAGVSLGMISFSSTNMNGRSLQTKRRRQRRTRVLSSSKVR